MSLRTPNYVQLVTDDSGIHDACVKSFHDRSEVTINGTMFVCVGYMGGGDTFDLREVVRVAPSKPNAAWSGEGLPPVGTVCEWKEKTGFSWVKATVLFITDSSVVMQREDGFEWQMLTKRTVFRPLPNPEQIAADKRMNSAMALYGAVMDSSGILFERLPLDRQEHYLKLVDEGWQQVKP